MIQQHVRRVEGSIAHRATLTEGLAGCQVCPDLSKGAHGDHGAKSWGLRHQQWIVRKDLHDLCLWSLPWYQYLKWPWIQNMMHHRNLPVGQTSVTSTLLSSTHGWITTATWLDFLDQGQGSEDLSGLVEGAVLRQDVPHEVRCSAQTLAAHRARDGEQHPVVGTLYEAMPCTPQQGL